MKFMIIIYTLTTWLDTRCLANATKAATSLMVLDYKP